MIKPIRIGNYGYDNWNQCLYQINGISNIYRNNKVIKNKYEVTFGLEHHYFNTFKEAVAKTIGIIKKKKKFNKYIPDIMRLTALIDVENK